MPTPNELIVHSLTVSHVVLQRYTADLTPDEYLHRPAPKANCAAWLIGHLTLTERNALKALGAELPQLPPDFERRFSQAEGCPTAEEFGDVTGLMALFNEHRTRLMDAVRKATPQQLDKPLEKPRPPIFTTAGDFANFVAVHSAMHAGQITIIRRSLGRPPLM
jgi:hypothetical protein